MNRMPEPDPPAAGSRAYRVLFVCTGNTCRSPMAEGILKKAVAELPDNPVRFDVRSAGTYGMDGFPATDNAIAICARYGIDLTAHRSQAVTPALLQESDLILALSEEHHESCINLGADPDRVFLLRAFPNAKFEPWRDSIRDPIGGDLNRYEQAFFEIEEAIRRALPGIRQRAGVAS